MSLRQQEELRRFTAWTDDHQFGGFQFSRGPQRDVNARRFSIPLATGRELTIRTLDSNNSPVENVPPLLHVATPRPFVNYLGHLDASSMVSDENGVATFPFFPDWDDVYCYADVSGNDWVLDGEHEWNENEMIIHVKPKKERRQIEGMIRNRNKSVAGFNLKLPSFQGETDHSDHLQSFSDASGRFTAEVLPNAVYCLFINDSEYISEMIDLVPFVTTEQKQAAAELNIVESVPATIKVTAGPDERPVAGVKLYVRQSHHYEWSENDETESGNAARDFFASTNEDGFVVVALEPNKEVEVTVRAPDWRSNSKIDVLVNGPNTVHLHREVEFSRRVFGRVTSDANIVLTQVEVFAGGADGQTTESHVVKVRSDGFFWFKTFATTVGILARTTDGKFAGVKCVDQPRRPSTIRLLPTGRIKGRLTKEGKPAAEIEVMLSVRIRAGSPHDQERKRGRPWFSAMQLKSTTDSWGRFAFEGVPANAEISIYTFKDGVVWETQSTVAPKG